MSARLNIIRRVLLSEKNTDRSQEDDRDGRRVYAFEVDIAANKVEIKKALMEAFNLEPGAVLGLNTSIRPGKPKKRGRARRGHSPDRKKAILTVSREIPELQQG
ncbi:MAG: 50S ribosomal protein L23 [Deltaproteobacteria bacterium]|jgi:large subunit ribosomal protein L23|nr:50S ribosomal protein L23 [Deltaproteobacteria bacterium]